MTLYTNGDTVWTYEQMSDEVFPAEIEGVDMDQFIGGELSFEDWLCRVAQHRHLQESRRGEAWPWQI
jgi:hypothetical protein